MGLTAENLALRYRISRKEQDEFALRSHQRGRPGHRLRRLRPTRSIPTWGRDEEGRESCSREDQCIRRDTSLEALAALKPAFMPEGGSVTAGNSSPLNVGAAALLIMSEEKAQGPRPQAEGARQGDGGRRRRSQRSWASARCRPRTRRWNAPA